MESWKQSALLAVAVAVAMMIGGGLQAWSLGQAPDLIVPVVGPAPESDIAHGRARLAQENPAWSQFVAAVESADVQQVMGYLDWQQHLCIPSGWHGGNAPLCSSLGLADGSSVLMFPEDWGGALPMSADQPGDQLGEGMWFRDRTSMQAFLTQLLSGRHAALELVMRGDDKQLYLSFSLDSAPNPDSGAPIVSVSFRAPVSGSVVVRAFAEGVASTTPFEVIGVQERQGHAFEFWGISDQLKERERAIDQERYGSPAHNAPPTGSATPTPTTTPLDAVRDRLKTEGSAGAVVDAAVAGDVDKLVGYLQLFTAVCLPPSDHGEPPLCSALGLPAGTVVQVATVGGLVPLPVPQEMLRQFFSRALGDKHARLVFVGKTPAALSVGIGFPAVTPPLAGLVTQPYSLFMFELSTTEPTRPIVRTLIPPGEPQAVFTEVYGGLGDIWYAEPAP
jgi:hypothetical protein